MADATFKINTAALVTLMRSPSGLVFREIRRKTNAVANYAKGSGNQMSNPKTGRNRWTYTKGRAPRASSKLANSIRPEVAVRGGEIVGIVTAHADYALFVHEGVSGGKTIRPKGNKRALAWKGDQGMVFAKKVRQGRVEKRPFLKDALDIVMKQP